MINVYFKVAKQFLSCGLKNEFEFKKAKENEMQTKNERFLINYFFSSDFTILILGFLSFLQGFTISILNFSSIVFKNFFLIFPTPTSAEFKHFDFLE